MTKQLAFSLAIALAVGCGSPAKRSESASPAIAEAPVERPASPLTLAVDDLPPNLFAVAVVPEPTRVVTDARAFVDAIDPGFANAINDALLDQLLGMIFARPPVPTIDHAQPLYLLFVDPQRAPLPFALSAAVTDEAALREWVAGSAGQLEVDVREGRAVIASPAVLATLGDYAFGPLLAAPRPQHATITAFAKPILAANRAAVEEALAQARTELTTTATESMPAELAGWYLDAFLSLLAQLQAVTVQLEANNDGASVVVGLVGQPGTALADFAARQRPSDYSLLARLTTPATAVVLAGEVDWTPLYEPMLAMTLSAMPGIEDDGALREVYRELMALYAGEVAMLTDTVGGVTFTNVFEVRDTAHARAVWLRYVHELGRAGAAMSFEPLGKPAVEHDGVAVDEYEVKLDYDKLPESQRETWQKMYSDGVRYTVATPPGMLVNVMAHDASERTRSLVAALGAAEPSGDGLLAPKATASRARHESLFAWLDLGRLMAGTQPGSRLAEGLGFSIGVGFAEDAALFRFEVDRATVEGLVAGASAATDATSSTPQSNPALVGAIRALADRACACADIECARVVQAELMALIQGAPEPPQDEKDAILADFSRMRACYEQLEDGSKPSSGFQKKNK